MIKLRPWKGSKHEYEVDVIVNGTKGRTVRRRVKAPVTGKANAERWAKALENELLAQLLAPEPEPERPPAPTFEEFAKMFLDLCQAERLGLNTRMHYELNLRRYVVPVIGKRRLDELKPADITAIKAAMSTKAHNTMCEVMKTLRRLMNVAVAQGVIGHLPFKIDMPRRRHRAVIAYNAQEQQALLDAATQLGPCYVVMLLLGMDAGLRRGEILALQWDDLDLARSRMIVRRNLVRGKLDIPKGRTEDEVALTSRLLDTLRAFRSDGSVFVLTNSRGNHLTEMDAAKWMRKIVTLAGVPWHGTHILRKTCGTRIADNGGGVAAVATHLRHKDLQTASRYIDRRGASSSAIKALET